MLKKNASQELEYLFNNSGGRIEAIFNKTPTSILSPPNNLKPKEKTLWNKLKNYDYTTLKKIAKGVGVASSIALLLLGASKIKKSKSPIKEQYKYITPVLEYDDEEEDASPYIDFSQGIHESALGFGGRMESLFNRELPNKPIEPPTSILPPTNLKPSEKTIWNKLKDYDYTTLKNIAKGVGKTALIAGAITSYIAHKQSRQPKIINYDPWVPSLNRSDRWTSHIKNRKSYLDFD